jgi:hypothetical protein
MGTSLADRAWNRDSAVYRVAGVFTVIGGWFVTALAALIISSVFVFICIKFQFVGVGIVIAFVGFAVYKLNQYHKETPSPVQISLEWKDEIFQAQHPEKFTAIVKERISESLSAFGRYTSSLVSAIANEDKDAIRLLGTQLDYLSNQNLTNRSQLAAKIGKMKPEQKKMARQVVEFYSLENHILMEMNRLDEVARLHILNMHRPLQEKQVRLLRELEEKISKFVGIAKVGLGANEPAIAEAALQDINQHTDHALDVQMEGVADGSFNFKNSNLFLTSMINLRSSADLFNRMIKRVYNS